MNDMIQTIIARRSCKKYKPDMVPAELIDQVVEAGLYAASGMGQQSPIFLRVTDKETRDKLSALNRKYDPKNRPDPFYGAPVVIPVLADKSVGTYVYDGSLCLGNMMLAAHSLGLGSCWIHRAKEVFEDAEGAAILQHCGITGDYEGIGNLVLGYADYLNPNIPARKEGRVWRID